MNTALGVVLLVLAAGLTPFFPSTADVLCDNIKQMAPTLSNNTSSSPLHFSTTTFGQAPDVVYALALCRGDVDDSVCGGCMASTFNLLLNLKPPPPQQCYEAAYYYGDLCAVIYSVDDILNTTGDDSNNGDDEPFTRWNTYSWGGGANWSIDDITGDAQDVSLTVGLLHQLLVETAQAAAAASATPRRFATGMMGKPMVFYTLAQCTPDLSEASCWACLNRLLGMVNTTIALRKGGQIHVIRCYISGYMAPEYASEGLYSIKSDVFSFGVLVLEIICGRRNSGGHKCGYFFNLLGYVSCKHI
nr:unnamed protein product [Digitaria exilis]